MGGKPPLPGRRPPSRSHLEGSAPLAPSPIYRGVRGGLQHTITQGAAPPLPNTSPPPYVLGEALSEYCCTNYTTPLDQDGGDVVRPVRVLNAEVLSVQHLVIGDPNHVEYDSIITIPLNASALDLQVVCRCKLFPLTRCLDELIDGSW